MWPEHTHELRKLYHAIAGLSEKASSTGFDAPVYEAAAVDPTLVTELILFGHNGL